MQFPITRERLQNYAKDEAMNVAVALKVDEITKRICHGVEVIATNNREKSYTHPIRDVSVTVSTRGIWGRADVSRPILNEVLEKLHELFPDCTIQVDPLKTYILIDWS